MLLAKFIFIIFIATNLTSIIVCKNQASESDSVNNKYLFIGLSTGYYNVTYKNALFQSGDAYCQNDIPYAYGDGYYAGINIKYIFNPENKILNSLNLKILYESLPSEYIVYYGDYLSINPDKTIDTLPTYMSGDMKISYLTFCMLYSICFNKYIPFAISVGPSMSYLLRDNFLQVYSLKPNYRSHGFTRVYGYVYTDNGNSVIIHDGNIEDINDFVFGIKAELSYEIRIGDNFIITPEVGYNLPMTNTIVGNDWRIEYFHAGLSVLCAID